jgi:hypothetical protein
MYLEILNSILQYLVFPATLVGIVSYASKQVFNNYLNKKLETYKSQLDKAFYEHQIKFSKLHEKRAEIISELYIKLIDAQISLKYFMSPIRFGKVDEVKFESETMEKWRAFMNYFSYNEIFFNVTTCERINSMIHLILDIWGNHELNKMSIENIKDFPKGSKDERVELRQRRKEIHEILENKVPEIEKLLKDDFRTIIGVN